MDMKERVEEIMTIEDVIARKLETIRVEYEAILTVLIARQSSAKDYEDWKLIREQTRDLLRVATRACNLAGI